MLLDYDFPDEYDIEIIDDDEIGELYHAKKIVINLNEDSIFISFSKNKKSDPILNVPIKSVNKVDPFVQSKGHFIKKDKTAIEFSFDMQSLGSNTLKTIRFFVEKESINVFMDHMNFLKESLINPAYRRYIKIYMNPTLCTECFNSKWKTITRLCENCNLKVHGNVIFHHKSAEYHGGHKAYPSGGTFGKFESGQMFLNEKSLVFIKDKKDEAKRIDIIIPFSSISLGNYDITAERKGGILGGAAVPLGDSDAYIGGLFSYEGKANRLCVPYIDEYGILQKPIFGISSFGGKEIRKWSHELYKRILELKSREQYKQPTKIDTTTEDNHTEKESKEDLLKILKMRLAKGEITREEYLELVKMIEEN